MHFLLGLLGFAGICYLFGIIFFNKEPDPAAKFRKGLITTLILCVASGLTIYFVYQYNEKKEKEREKVLEMHEAENSENDTDAESISSAPTNVKLRILEIEELTKNNIPGLAISLGGSFQNLKPGNLNFAVWFYFGEKGAYDNDFIILKDFNNKYATTDGAVTVQTGDVVRSKNGTVFSDSIPKLFIPLTELHLQKNYHDINQGRILESEKIKMNNRIGLKAGVFQDDKSLDETGFQIYNLQ